MHFRVYATTLFVAAAYTPVPVPKQWRCAPRLVKAMVNINAERLKA